jgi:hypothetical protein
MSQPSVITSDTDMLHSRYYTVKTTPSDPDFPFCVHKHVGASQPTFVPDLNVPFDLEFRRTLSIGEFVADLAETSGQDIGGESDQREDRDIFRVNK